MNFVRSKWGDEDFAELREFLYAARDKKYLEFISRTIPNTEMYGIRVPVLRGYAKQICKGNFRDFLGFKAEIHEEILLCGIIVACAVMPYEEKKFYIDKLLPLFSNWAHVDITAGGIKDCSHFDEVRAYTIDKREFVIRYGYVRMLSSYVNDEYIQSVLDCATSAPFGKFYYVDMAVAWLLSVCYVKYRDRTKDVISCLPDGVKRMTKQKIRDSFRVSQGDKEILQSV